MASSAVVARPISVCADVDHSPVLPLTCLLQYQNLRLLPSGDSRKQGDA